MIPPDFAFDEKVWSEFASAVRALNDKGVKVLLLTTPVHPFVAEAPAADPDGTSHEGDADVVRHLHALDEKLPLAWFRDFNRDGHHDFPHEQFYDADHLNRKGSRALTKLILAWMDESAQAKSE